MKSIVIFVIVSVIIAITSGKMSVERSSPNQIEAEEEERPIVGGVQITSDHSKVEELLKNNIKQLKNNESELSLVKIEESSSQVVAGMLYKAIAIMSDLEENLFRVNLQIWEKPWLDFVEITINSKEKLPK